MHSSENSENLPLVFLPGMGCDQRLWSEMLPHLSPRLKPQFPNFDTCSSTEEMIHIIEKLSYPTFALLGFSAGGYLAQDFAMRFPKRISHLILIASSAGGQDPGRPHRIALQIEKINSGEIDPCSDNYLSPFVDSRSRHSLDALNTMREMIRSTGNAKLVKQMDALAKRENLIHSFDQIKFKTLVIGARFDLIIPKSRTEDLARSLNADLEWVNSGHMSPIEDPLRTVQIINSWIEAGDHHES